MEAFSLREKIWLTIQELDSSLDPELVMLPFEDHLNHMVTSQAELSSLSEHRDQYQNSWAFSYANEEFQKIISGVFTMGVQERIQAYAGKHKNRFQKDDIIKKFEVIEHRLRADIRKTHSSPRSFQTANYIVAMAEIILTLAIVLGITEVTRAVNEAISLPKISILIVGVFGILKMLLEKAKQRILMNWRWNTYQDTVDKAFDGLAVISAIGYMLAAYVQQGSFLAQIDDLLEKGVTLLTKPMTKEEKRIRRAKHKASYLHGQQMERLKELRHTNLQHTKNFTGVYNDTWLYKTDHSIHVLPSVLPVEAETAKTQQVMKEKVIVLGKKLLNSSYVQKLYKRGTAKKNPPKNP